MLFLYFLIPTLLIGWGISELVSSDDNDETLEGGDEDNVIDGNNGNDFIDGGGGDDNLEGGSGNDTVNGGDGDDVISGQQNGDTLDGGAGDDLIVGERGNDLVTGGAGSDWVEGDDGSDTVSGGSDDDTVIGSNESDTLTGDDGDDLLIGGGVPGTPLDLDDLVRLRDGESLVDVRGVTPETNISLRDDGDADALDGGTGDDILVLGAGDSGTGGDGDDQFWLMADALGRDAGPALISDFTSDDGLVLLQDASGGGTPTISVTDDGDDAIVSVDDVVLARVAGAAGTLSAADISVLSGVNILTLDPNA